VEVARGGEEEVVTQHENEADERGSSRRQ